MFDGQVEMSSGSKDATAKLVFIQSWAAANNIFRQGCFVPVALYMLSSHCFQLSAHLNTTEFMLGNYRNVTGEVEKLFSSPASFQRWKTKGSRHVLSVSNLLSLS